MENYWHKNREFPESVENHLNRKADLVNGKVPSSQLPSYVDDVLEFNAFENLPVSGEKGKIYLITNNNTQFRWSGSEYIQINSDENLMTVDTVQDITGHKQFNGGLSLGLNQRMYIKTASDVAHYVANFADDLDGFAVSKGFAIKPFNDTASNWFLVNDAGAYSNGKKLATESQLSDYFNINLGYGISNQSELQPNGLQSVSIGNSENNFDGDLANKTIEGTFANFNGYTKTSKNLGFTLFAPTSTNQGIYYKTWYNGGAQTTFRKLWDSNDFNPTNFVLPSSDNWTGNPTITDRKVVGELAWKNYGNGHTIFDISSGVTPWGDTKSNINAETPWSPSFPTLVGGNGSGTYGVRVDSARVADTLTGGYTPSSFITTDSTPQAKNGDLTLNGSLKINSIGTLGTFRGISNTGNYLNWLKYDGSQVIAYIGSDAGSAGGGGVGNDFVIRNPNANLQLLTDVGIVTYNGSEVATKNWVTNNHDSAGYLKARGAHQDAYAANIDYPISITDYAGGSRFHSTYGNSLHIKGINTWHSRLDIPTDGDRIELWQGINTTTMSKRGYLPVIEEGQNVATQNWTKSFGLGSTTGVVAGDLNDIKHTSIYDLNSTQANSPFGYGSVWTHRKSSTELTQISVNVLNGILYTRGVSDGLGDTGWKRNWSEGDFSKTDIDNWNNLASTAATQSWVESQDYATHSFVEESLNKITSEHIDPDYSISARSNLNTIIITDQYPVQYLKLENDLAPGKQMTIINTAPFDIEVHKDGNIVDIVRSEETNEYYITRQQKLVKKGFYGNAKILS